MAGTYNQTILGEQDVFGGLNQNDAASGDYSAIYNASEVVRSVALGGNATTNSFTLTGNGGATGVYRIRATVEGPSPAAWKGGSASLILNGSITVATFGPSFLLGSFIETLVSGSYAWQINVGNAAPSEPSSGDPVQPYTGIPVGLKLFVEPI